MEIIKASYYISALRHKTEKTPERITDSYEFELCTKGEGYAVINGKKIWRSPGMLILAKPNQIRYSIGHFECYYIHFNLAAEDDLKPKVDSLPDFYFPEDISRIDDIFHNVSDKRFSNQDNEEVFLKGAVMQLTAELDELLYPLGIRYAGKYERYINEVVKAKQYIENNYGAQIDLKTVAQLVNLSPNFFRVVFKNIIDLSPHEYLKKVRISKAKDYLVNTDLRMAQIAAICGFETQSYFNTVFRKAVGKTPYKYRELRRKEI